METVAKATMAIAATTRGWLRSPLDLLMSRPSRARVNVGCVFEHIVRGSGAWGTELRVGMAVIKSLGVSDARRMSGCRLTRVVSSDT